MFTAVLLILSLVLSAMRSLSHGGETGSTNIIIESFQIKVRVAVSTRALTTLVRYSHVDLSSISYLEECANNKI